VSVSPSVSLFVSAPWNASLMVARGRHDGRTSAGGIKCYAAASGTSADDEQVEVVATKSSQLVCSCRQTTSPHLVSQLIRRVHRPYTNILRSNNNSLNLANQLQLL